MRRTLQLSIIVPVYNESNRLGNVYNIAEYLKKLKIKSELIVVNDGSNDKTLKMLNDISNKIKFKIISYDKNKGKGFAVKTGMLSANGKYRLFTDIDLSVPIEECGRFIDFMKLHPVVIGSRKKGSSRIILHQPKMRELMGSFFTLLSQKTLGLEISDFTCGFKCFSEEAARNIFNKVRIDRWGFDSEIIFVSHKLGYKIFEIPVAWSHDPSTKVKFPQDVFSSLIELILIRFYNFVGAYNRSI